MCRLGRCSFDSELYWLKQLKALRLVLKIGEEDATRVQRLLL